ncbi:hypothetical protein ACIBF6_09290 [Streptosporangium amethystogenes]|uniref:hypothetical protein n=1 Tax=Streptosporangium amethystogenes TaxID=2002 RepID=UPI0037BB09D8
MKRAKYDIQATYRVDFEPSVTRTITGGTVSKADTENLRPGWIAKRAGHGVDVLLRVYAKRIDGRQDHINDALT